MRHRPNITPLLAIATERATPAQRDVLATVGRADLSSGGVATIQQVLVDTGALAELEEVIERLVSDALDAVGVAPITDDARKALTELAHFVAWRER